MRPRRLQRVERIRTNLLDVLRDKLDLEAATRKHAHRWRRVAKGGIPVAMQVTFENDVSKDFTIIDVFAQDRPGLLYTITRTLSQQGLTIERAKISTEGARAIDSFYVGKLVAPEALKELREALEQALDERG